MWNLKNKINKQTKNALIDTKNKFRIADGKGVRKAG